MKIIEFYYNDDNRRLYVEFSTEDDGDSFYRVLELGFEDIEYHSPSILIEEDMDYIDEEFIVELLNQYLLDNDLPEEKTL
jgi:hypothetical protein